MENQTQEKEKQTPFLKRISELEQKVLALEAGITNLSRKIEIVVNSLRR